MAPYFTRPTYNAQEVSLARESFNAIVSDQRAGNPSKVSNINVPEHLIRSSNLSRQAQRGPDWRPPGISSFGFESTPPTALRPSSARAGYRAHGLRGGGLLAERVDGLGAEAAQAYRQARERQKSCPSQAPKQAPEVRPAGVRTDWRSQRRCENRCGAGEWQLTGREQQTTYGAMAAAARAAWRLDEAEEPAGPTSLPGRHLPSRLHDPGQRPASRPPSGKTSGFGRQDQRPQWAPDPAPPAEEPNYDLEAVPEPAPAFSARPAFVGGPYRALYGRR